MRYFKLPLDLPVKKLRSPIIYLAVIWVTGLVVGMYFAFAAQASVSYLMHAVVYCRVSIVGLLSVLFFPLVASAIAIFVPLFLYPISFFKALSYGFCFYSVMFAFGDAGWLFVMLLLFSDSLMIVLLNWLWCRQVVGSKNSRGHDLICCSIAAALIGLMDYFLVSPYLVDLLHYF